MNFKLFIIMLLLLQGCRSTEKKPEIDPANAKLSLESASPATINGASEDSFKRSVDKIKNQIDFSENLRFDLALQWFDSENPQPLVVRKKLDGKTVHEIIAEYDQHIKILELKWKDDWQKNGERWTAEARKREDVNRKQEKAKKANKLRSPEEAIAEWQRFRTDEDAHKGSITTWRFKVEYFDNENPIGFLDRVDGYGSEYGVCITNLSSTYQAATMFRDVPLLKSKDWVVVTGEFAGVTSDNIVILMPIRVRNEGYRP